MHRDILQKSSILKRALEQDNINCGVFHEQNTPYQSCKFGITPRRLIGCMHSDIPLLLADLLESDFLQNQLNASVLRSFQDDVVSLKEKISCLDNRVYEKELTDQNVINEKQDELSVQTRHILSRLFQYLDPLIQSFSVDKE